MNIFQNFLAAASAVAILCGTAVGADYPQTRVEKIVREVAQEHGIDQDAFVRMAEIESAMNPRAYHPRSKACGVFQFIPTTARAYGLRDCFDAEANATAAVRLWADNADYLRAALEREPTDGAIYLAHQQGAGNAVKLLTNADELATRIVGRKAVIRNDGSEDMTAGDFASKWTSRFE